VGRKTSQVPSQAKEGMHDACEVGEVVVGLKQLMKWYEVQTLRSNIVQRYKVGRHLRWSEAWQGSQQQRISRLDSTTHSGHQVHTADAQKTQQQSVGVREPLTPQDHALQSRRGCHGAGAFLRKREHNRGSPILPSATWPSNNDKRRMTVNLTQQFENAAFLYDCLYEVTNLWGGDCGGA